METIQRLSQELGLLLFFVYEVRFSMVLLIRSKWMKKTVWVNG